ncbi:MAG: SDR family oxidoreductase [Cyclobacteriaceae bacterium]
MMEDYLIQNSRVLVTGGAGFIGSNLCEALLKQNNHVVCLDNFATGQKKNIEGFFTNPNFQLIEGDICDLSTCKKAVKNCKFVLHQAALGSVPRSLKDPCTSVNVNIGGFTNMLWASVQEGVFRFVYAASSSTYGDHAALPKQEHIIGKPLSPYAITKYVDELIAANFSKSYGIETVGLRYFNVFGRRQDPNGAYAAVIPKFVDLLLSAESPVINGDGSHSRDFTYIDNVIQANQRAATLPKEIFQLNTQTYYTDMTIDHDPANDPISEVFNVAHGERTSLVELFELLKGSLVNNQYKVADIHPIYGPKRAGDIPHSHASITKAKSILGYQPTFNFRQGIQETIDWYINNQG